jgi:hypothetical protein
MNIFIDRSKAMEYQNKRIRRVAYQLDKRHQATWEGAIILDTSTPID